MGSNENNARGYRKPVREITKQCQLEKTRHQIGHTRPKAASSETQLWRIFAIQWAVLFSSSPKISRVQCSVPANIYPKVLAQEVLKEPLFCYELGIDKGAQLDWRGHRCKKSGALADTKGGKSNRAASFVRFRLQLKGRRANPRRPWSRD